MKTKFSALVLLLAMAVLELNAAPVELPKVVLGQQGIVLGKWLLLGPFETKTRTPAIDVDFISRFGRKESDVSIDNVVASVAGSSIYGPLAKVADRGDLMNFVVVYNSNWTSRGMPETAVYAACEIVAEKPREAWLLFGSDDGAKIWLNGEICYTHRENRILRKYDDAVPLALKRGRNLLFVKVVNVADNWQMAARLEPDRAAALETVLGGTDGFLRKVTIADGQPLELSVHDSLSTSAPLSGKIETITGQPVCTVQLNETSGRVLRGLSHGLYRVVILFGGSEFQSSFCLGGIPELASTLQARSEVILHHAQERVAINVNTLLMRLKILGQPYRASPNEYEGRKEAFIENNERKAVDTAEALTDILASIEKGREPFRDRPGLHLRGFRSRIDDQVMHYRLFVPSGYNRSTGLPLVIVPSPVFSTPRPFIESVFVADHQGAKQWVRIAERLGIGILWPGYRVCPYGNPIDFAHFDEVMAAVASDYRLDTSRLYLCGYCSAGLTASMEAVRHPRHYAAIAYMSPVLHRVKNRYDDAGDYVGNPTYRAWLRETDPVELLARTPDLPIWIVHNGNNPEHGPLSHTVDFVELARAYGNQPRFDRSKENPPPKRLDTVERQLVWLAAQRRKKTADFDFTPVSSNDIGPLSRAFAERFVVVRGTLGNATEKAAAARWCQAFEDAWKRTNYVPCRVIDDVEITDAEEQASNLVLIGNPETNAAWRRMAARLNAGVGLTEVSAAGKTWHGESLALEAWCPHPSHPERKIVLIGAANLEHAAVGTMELALDGWFDYAVWRPGTRKPELAAAGQFSKK